MYFNPISSSGSTGTEYSSTFSDSDFSGGEYIVSAATHGKGLSPGVQVFELDGSDYTENTSAVEITIDSSGNVTVTVTVGDEFTGKIIIH